MIEELHETHPGICKMKSLARSYVWWPNMDKDLESRVRTCENCQMNRKNPPEAPLHPWEWPSRPWERIHIDYAGPFLGKMFPIMIDAYSKWIEVHPVNTATSRVTIEKLRSTFAIHGLPMTIVSDSDSNFCTEKFEEFMAKNGHFHVLYHQMISCGFCMYGIFKCDRCHSNIGLSVALVFRCHFSLVNQNFC